MKQVLCFLLCVACITVFAQENSNGNAAKVWTLKECVDYALANNLNIQRGHYNVEGSEVDLLQAKMAMLPSLNASVSNGYNWGRSINPVTNQFTTQQITSLSPGANSS